MKDGVTDKAKETYEGVTGWFNDMYTKVVGGSIVPDMVTEVIAEFVKQEEAVVGITKDTTRAVTQELHKVHQTWLIQVMTLLQNLTMTLTKYLQMD
jgi:hypothetical protein